MSQVFADVLFFLCNTPFALGVICQTPAGINLVEYEYVFNATWLERENSLKFSSKYLFCKSKNCTHYSGKQNLKANVMCQYASVIEIHQSPRTL